MSHPRPAPHAVTLKRPSLLPSLLTSLLLLSGCLSRDEEFTAGRLEARCEASIPVCATRAACALNNTTFASGRFPGAQRAIVYTPHPRTTLTARLLLDDQEYPGTELLVRAYQVGCVDVFEERLADIDIFQRAGDDRALDFTFELEGRGDHLIEWYSDAAASYTLTVSVAFKASEE
jgi:hypothetical protein